MKRLLRLLLVCSAVLALGLAGCRTTDAQPKPASTAEAGTEEIEVKTAGSWIPRKVKKKSELIGEGTKTTDAGMLDSANQAGSARIPHSDTGR